MAQKMVGTLVNRLGVFEVHGPEETLSLDNVESLRSVLDSMNLAMVPMPHRSQMSLAIPGDEWRIVPVRAAITEDEIANLQKQWANESTVSPHVAISPQIVRG